MIGYTYGHFDDAPAVHPGLVDGGVSLGDNENAGDGGGHDEYCQGEDAAESEFLARCHLHFPEEGYGDYEH